MLELPDSLHKKVREIAKKDNVSINQFINSALAEKIAAFLTEEYLEERAKRGSREKFERVLSKVPDVQPEEYDRL
ncbi:toxin-antitoxin system HicB family antitoxin [candidate division KSB1 bacterium]|nr:toxin-antitoxin system HicB family antitoxin [candidate division KSB1 bacterium]NIR71279.1 toxin-antitoxin system HicB family antitoxin [candidate division KSB1 bacterium]NIS24808.1 toxin-antitoxin system HicB family antitoxin [candidate division KSB1 bacterium]NIT71715.1 toxin-antitoxin system HicB family antitoxin [candidate division KSB1 bacterium]NIU25444.1 toxin-antitoxin system HicB family antitoxin [candidate division KSB1 bacterium]